MQSNENSNTTKRNMIKIKRRGRKKIDMVASPQPEKQSVISVSNMSSYELPKKFMTKYQTIKKPAQDSINLDEGYKEMESILGNKNLSYGYGDSKNREKVLKFITDMKTKQNDDKEKTVSSVKERMANIDQLINGLENDYAHFSYEVGMCEEGLNSLKKVTEDNDYRTLRNFIETYDDINELMQSPEEFQDYVNELWNNHAELEQELEVERKDHNWDIRVLEHELQSKIEWIQNKSSLYIEALEQAMNEVKMNKNREIDQLHLIIADIEGNKMREIIPDEEINLILKQDHTNVCVITDAHDLISRLKNCVRTVYYENFALKRQLISAK